MLHPDAKEMERPVALTGPGHLPRARSLVIGGGLLVLVLGGYWYFNNRSDSGADKRGNAAPVQGTLESANFKEGQFVKKGDLLFQIDPRPFQAALAQAQAIYERDQAQ